MAHWIAAGLLSLLTLLAVSTGCASRWTFSDSAHRRQAIPAPAPPLEDDRPLPYGGVSSGVHDAIPKDPPMAGSSSAGSEESSSAAAELGAPADAICGDAPAPKNASSQSLMERINTEWETVLNDHVQFYSWPTMRDLAIGMGAAAIAANTSIDQSFRDTYQRDWRCGNTEQWAKFWKTFGEGALMIPTMAGVAVVGKALDDRPVFRVLGNYGSRVTRSYLVGGPPVLFLQYALGPARPDEYSPHTSTWQPFSDNHGVSGHAFIGSVPWITAAKMVDNPWLAGGFYAGSTLTAWSRINDDRHYLSQAFLGWWMAYLACTAVDRTEEESRRLQVVPTATAEMTGLSLIYSR